MDRIVEVLLEEETMTGDKFRELLSQYVDLAPAGDKKELAGVSEM